MEIGFTTDNVQKSYYQALEAGATPVKPPTEMPWGQTVAWVKDCNGFLVEMGTEVG